MNLFSLEVVAFYQVDTYGRDDMLDAFVDMPLLPPSNEVPAPLSDEALAPLLDEAFTPTP